MGIRLLYQPLGSHPGAIKGYFIIYKRIRAITVNMDLPPEMQRIITAHELGHAVHHKGSRAQAFHDVVLFDQTSALEKEANLFAAELLLTDEAVVDVLNQDMTFYSAASQLQVPMELLDFKFRIMKWKGYKLIEPPEAASSTFLKNMGVPQDGYSEDGFT
jgi:Zn-dependent peptidase ImmA (M78 family)